MCVCVTGVANHQASHHNPVQWTQQQEDLPCACHWLQVQPVSLCVVPVLLKSGQDTMMEGRLKVQTEDTWYQDAFHLVDAGTYITQYPC